MALPKGIKVQPSRYSALSLDTDSDSDASGDDGWWEVAGGGKTNKPKVKGGSGPGQQHKDGPPGAKPLSKNAKKRARKKKNQQSSSEQSKSVGETQGDVGINGADVKVRQEREAEVADLEFHRELEEALLKSKLTAEQEQEIDRQRKAAAVLKKQSKKGVKLSLQSLHRADLKPESDQSPKAVETVNDDSAFFERLSHDVENEIRKKQERRVSESQMSPVEESARVAHVMDELEKRDKAIAALKRENGTLKGQMKEVKERNQQLCKILAQGEFSSKTQLLEQIEELTTVKNELTTELQYIITVWLQVKVTSLHSNLEQERSRNKSLQAELTKLTSIMGKKRHHS